MDTPRSRHDLSHLIFQAGRIGRLQTLSCVPCLPGDGVELDLVGALRLSPLRRGMAVDSVVDICTFYVPHRHIFGQTWIDFIEQGWDESQTLATETTPASGLSSVGAGRVPASFSLTKWYGEGYRQIYNNYYRPPTTVAARTDLTSTWGSNDAIYGFRVANLKNMWTTVMANGLTSSDYNVSAAGSVVSLLDISMQRGYLRSEIERTYFDTRYRDLMDRSGGHTTIDADNRPQLLMRSTVWASGYDVDGTTEVSLGQFSGRVVQSFRHRVPRFHAGEHGNIWTMACLRFPMVHEEENPFFVTNPNPTYALLAGDADIVATQPPYGLRTRDVFASSADATVRGMIPYAQWYRYHPSLVHEAFDNLNGFPFLSDIPGSTADMVLVDDQDFDDVFQTTQLGHYQIHARMNAPWMRRLPPASSSLNAGG